LTVERREHQAVLSVSDQGIGIPAAAQEHLFDRFYRAPNTETWRIGGMGIGLSVVREIVRLHGGTVSVDSQEGVGTTFTVCLPLRREILPR
jgi:signal transduction histidine kinase